VIKHVLVSDLPRPWQEKLVQAGSATVTVRIEEEAADEHPAAFISDDPAFGIWRDREDMGDVLDVSRDRGARRQRGGFHCG
jgi:hypothetical protein